jgi:hypothetical protein
MNFETIYKYITEHFPSELVYIVSVLIVILFVFKYGKQFIDVLKDVGIFKWLGKNKHKEITVKDLENHYLFTHINYLRTVKINLLNFGDEARNYIVRMLLRYKLNNLEVSIRNLIRTTDLNSISSIELDKLITQMMYNCLTQYIDEFKLEAHTDEEKAVADVVVETLWKNHNENIEFELKGFRDVIYSPIYENNLVRIHSILLPIMVSCEAFLVSTEKSLNQLNGRLSNKSFHGLKFK